MLIKKHLFKLGILLIIICNGTAPSLSCSKISSVFKEIGYGAMNRNSIYSRPLYRYSQHNTLEKEVNIEHLKRSVETFFSLEELQSKLNEKRPLRIKYGVDATAPFLHLGHAVNLWVMRHFQECGHKVIFLIGDTTTTIGDPTGRSQLRKMITPQEIEDNGNKFIAQVGKVLITDPSVFEVRRNSEWFGSMPLPKFLELTSMLTHSKLIQRNMFQERLKEGREIYIHEMLYPILQGYDSVMLKADLTVVGNDQFYNETIGRFYQEKFKQVPQIVMTTKITPGIDGKEKQSKSLGNYIALEDSSRDMFGKLMSISDSLIFPYLEVYTTVPISEINEMSSKINTGDLNPVIAKKKLAYSVVDRYYGAQIAQEELEWFQEVFSKRHNPSDLPIVKIDSNHNLLEVLKLCLPDQSKSSLRKLILQGAVSLNGNKLLNSEQVYAIEQEAILKIGKRKWFKLQRL